MMDDITKRLNALTGGIRDTVQNSEERIIEGSSAANYVRARMSTRLSLKSMDIDASLMTPERKLMLEEFIVSTVNDLLQKVIGHIDEERRRGMQNAAAQMMSSITPDMMKNVTATINGKDGKINITDPKAIESITEMIKKLMPEKPEKE